MPGICGIISKKSSEKSKQDILKMLNCLLHEDFYSSGTYFNEEIGIFLGWTCHKESFSDCMPVINEKKDLVMVFFGEDFCEKDVFTYLKSKNHKFDKYNASYLIHLYEESGIEFLKDLNGWFNGVLIDIRKEIVYLFNDRYGMQRIYYYEGRNDFLFSAEAKSLLKVRQEIREIDLKSLGEYFTYECVLDNRTLFRDIFLLPGASLWSFKKSSLYKKEQYFKKDLWENQPWLEKEFFYKELKKMLIKIMPKYFKSNQQIGISLTGGLDTRIIMACMEFAEGKHPCYTFGSMYRDCYDVKIAKKVSKLCNQQHYVLKLTKDFLKNFPYYAEKSVNITDGSLDVSSSPELFLNQLAREIAPIRMTGNFGSEVLRGSRFLWPSFLNKNLFCKEFVRYVDIAKNRLNSFDNEMPLSFTLFTEAPWLENRRLICEQSQLTLRTPYMDNDLVKLMYRCQPEHRNTKELSLKLIRDYNNELSKISTDRGVGGDTNFLSSRIKRSYLEFFFKSEYTYNYGMPQWLSKIDYTFKCLHIEKLFLGRHKFAHFRLWYRDELASYVKEILLDNRTNNRAYYNKHFLEKMVKGHTSGYRNYTREITKVLTVELINRLLIEQR
jgi:asparagine synthase (glutamine-hydrolysing)